MKTRSKTTKASTAAKAAKTTRATAESTTRAAEANGAGAIRAPIQFGGRTWWPSRFIVSDNKTGEPIEVDGYTHGFYGIFEKQVDGGYDAACVYLAEWRGGSPGATVVNAFDSLRAAAAAARIDEAIGSLVIGSDDLDLTSCSFTLSNAMFLHLGFQPTGRIDLDERIPIWHLPPIEEMRDLP